MELAPGLQCDDPDPFAGASVTYEDSLPDRLSTKTAPLALGTSPQNLLHPDGFRAGWVSTAIRCSGASVVYHDASVVYLEALGRYLMFVVECDGRGMAVGGGSLEEGQGGGCSICVPSSCLEGGTPKTRYVFFTCPAPDFQVEVRGPFPVAPAAPDYSRGQWLGVPQAFMSPEERYLFFYMGCFGYLYEGLHFARVKDLAADILILEGHFDAGGDLSGKGELFYQNFTRVDMFLECSTPSSPVAGATPTLTDEHFVFCEDGYLHLYFSNRNPQTQEELANLFSLKPTLVSHAVAEEAWREPVMIARVSMATPKGPPAGHKDGTTPGARG